MLLRKRNGKQISSYLPAGTFLRFSPSRMITPCDNSAMMCFVVLLTKLFDRQVVDADQFCSLLDQLRRGVQIEVSKISVKLRF